MLKMMGYDKKIKNISAITSIITFVSCYFLINLFGIIGVGFSYILKNLLYNLWCSIFLYKKNAVNIFNSNYLKSIFLYFMAFIVCYFFFVVEILNPLQILITIVVFYIAFLLLWFSILGRKEIPQIINLLKNDK
jgi:O-antigen/teichoic acid export membrane protein